jgi:hypothetical protein
MVAPAVPVEPVAEHLQNALMMLQELCHAELRLRALTDVEEIAVRVRARIQQALAGLERGA